jgi:hypothetical protein
MFVNNLTGTIQPGAYNRQKAGAVSRPGTKTMEMLL